MADDGSRAGSMRDFQYLVLVLRLLVDRHGTIQQGELIDTAGHTVGRFRQPEDIPALVSGWLAPGSTAAEAGEARTEE